MTTSPRPVITVRPAMQAPGVTCWANTENADAPESPTRPTRHHRSMATSIEARAPAKPRGPEWD
jgi:hypothetical protein